MLDAWYNTTLALHTVKVDAHRTPVTKPGKYAHLQGPTSFTQQPKLRQCWLQGATFVNQYIVIKTMGRGAYGKVKLCLDSQTHELYAIKVINHARAARRIRALPSRQPYSTLDADVVQEIAVMKQLDHPNIVRLVEVIGEGLVLDFWWSVEVAGLHGAMLQTGAGTL